MTFCFSCLTALVRIFSTVLRRIGKNGHPCFVPEPTGQFSAFHLENNVTHECFLCDFYSAEVYSFCTQSLRSFYCEFCDRFSASIEIILGFYPFMI